MQLLDNSGLSLPQGFTILPPYMQTGIHSIAPTLAIILSCLCLTGCGKPSSTPSPGSTAPRVASLAPSITEIICALDASGQLIGRSTACDYPPDIVASIPIIGAFGVPSMERLLSHKPDIAFFTDLADNDVPSRLRAAGITPVHVQCNRLDEVPSAIRTVGQWLHRQPQAATLAAAMESSIAEYRARIPPEPQQPRVLVLIWHDPLTAAGSKSFLTELITLAGGRNVADDIARDYFPVSGEWVVSRNPDVIFCFFMSSGTAARDVVLRRPGWQNIKAIRTERVYDGMDNNLILRPGPRMMQGVEAMQQRLRESNGKP